MRISKITKIEPKPARCIEVDSPDRLFAAGGESGAHIVTHNSVAQRNILFGCIMRPDRWRILGVDLKKVELSSYRAYSNVVLGVATELEDALLVMRYAQETMMKRYAEMETLGVQNFLDLPDGDQRQALLVMCDEVTELLGAGGVKALSEHTPVHTPDGIRPLGEIEVGDVVLDDHSQPATVLSKYEPPAQDRYSMDVSDGHGNSDHFISGAEHYWVAYFEAPDGTVTGPETVDTEYLYRFKQEQDALPESERTKVRFRRSA